MNEREVQQQLPLPSAGSEAGGLFVVVIVCIACFGLSRIAPDVPFGLKGALGAVAVLAAFRYPGRAIVVMLVGIAWLIGSH